MFDAYDRDDPGRQMPHHRFFVADREAVHAWCRAYRALRNYGLSEYRARAEIVRSLLHDDRAKFR